MIKICLFGSPQVYLPETSEVGVLSQPKRLALLAFLLAGSRSKRLSRETLLGTFWPELDGERARMALRKGLHYLRQTLGKGAIMGQGDLYVAANMSELWCDVCAFHDAYDAARFEEALALYQGDLLPGFYVDGAPEFERWLELERERVRAMARTAAMRLVEIKTAEGALRTAVFWARRAELIAPDDEEVTRTLISLLGRMGNRAEALDVFTGYARRMQRDYDAQPSPELRRMAERLQKDGVDWIGSGAEEARNRSDDLVQQLDFYRSMVESAGDVIYQTDLQGFLTYANAAGVALTGYSREELIGTLYLDLVHPDYRDDVLDFYTRQIEERTPLTYYEFPAIARSGRELWIGQKVRLVLHADQPIGMLSIARDITTQRRVRDSQRNLSLMDRHTQLYNRRALYVLLEQRVRLARRTGIGFSLLRIVLSGPHDAGATTWCWESVLGALAQTLHRGLRASDSCARIGPTTVAILPGEVDSGDSSAGIVARVRDAFQRLRADAQFPPEVTARIELACYDPANEMTVDMLLDTACAEVVAAA